MPAIEPIRAVRYAASRGGAVTTDITNLIAPPYDVLDERGKAGLLALSANNIVAIDLPHLPAKTVGPDSAYHGAGELYRRWLGDGVMFQQDKPALFIYQQTFNPPSNPQQTFKRRGLISNVRIQPFGPCDLPGLGGVHPHEQTFSEPKADRLKLMEATQAQLSPIFGIYSDEKGDIQSLLDSAIAGRKPAFAGRTASWDQVLHEVWVIDDAQTIHRITQALAPLDVFIADGHHRYTTALNYQQQVKAAGKRQPEADWCMFVLVSLQDPGMIVQPTHRVIGGLNDFSIEKLIEASRGQLDIRPFAGNDPASLERELPTAGNHALGLYDPRHATHKFWLATTVEKDPLAKAHASRHAAWRQLDVAIVQETLVLGLLQPRFCPAGAKVSWKFPHTLDQLLADTQTQGYQLGVIVQPTPLQSVIDVSRAGELMPQKSTFFWPKLATGLVIHPLT